LSFGSPFGFARTAPTPRDRFLGPLTLKRQNGAVDFLRRFCFFCLRGFGGGGFFVFVWVGLGVDWGFWFFPCCGVFFWLVGFESVALVFPLVFELFSVLLFFGFSFSCLASYYWDTFGLVFTVCPFQLEAFPLLCTFSFSRMLSTNPKLHEWATFQPLFEFYSLLLRSGMSFRFVSEHAAGKDLFLRVFVHPVFVFFFFFLQNLFPSPFSPPHRSVFAPRPPPLHDRLGDEGSAPPSSPSYFFFFDLLTHDPSPPQPVLSFFPPLTPSTFPPL